MNRLLIVLGIVFAMFGMALTGHNGIGKSKATSRTSVEQKVSKTTTSDDEWSYYSYTTKFKLNQKSNGDYYMTDEGFVDIYYNGKEYGTRCKVVNKYKIVSVSRNGLYGRAMDNCPQQGFKYRTFDDYYINID